MSSRQIIKTARLAEWKAAALVKAELVHDQITIEVFLRTYLNSQSAILAEERKVYRKLPTPELAGQIKYHAHQVATIKWLLSLNEQRTVSGESHDDNASHGKRSGRTVPNSSMGSVANRKVRGSNSDAG